MKYTEKLIRTDRYTVTIRRPDLNDCDRKKREQELVKALERFGKEMEKRNAT